ncbi:MmcQ/YjbR family DNA-binding protein [Streptomyces sp. TLI_171]|uniref:MmcQ/YjbR family DNA-binding protein n=1 Tax=Streptomyces sp. TLI_171 TaxID=1938859 RepID=UPI000C19D3C0|nr:MmcQ/YjbR family DNA-binding protein [Streptomyces sp. TLI_171]
MATFDELSALALALPRAHREITWEQVTFRVGRKIFAMGAPESGAASVKARPEEQAELIAAAPEVFAVAPYTGRFGWVRVQLAGVETEELRELLTEAWRSVAPKKVLKEYGE